MAFEDFDPVEYESGYAFEGWSSDVLPKTIGREEIHKASGWLRDHGYEPTAGHFETLSSATSDDGQTVGQLEKRLDVHNFRYVAATKGELLIGPYALKKADGSLTLITGEAAISRWQRAAEIVDDEIEPGEAA